MIHSILKDIKEEPTIMDILDEVKFIRRLKNLRNEDIYENLNIFFEILEIIDTSHTQSIFQMNKEILNEYIDFGRWIRKHKEYIENKKLFLENFAQNMEAVFKFP